MQPMFDIADKIAKLLAKAEGTDNPHEAEAFSAAAEELMLKHGIEEAQIAANRPGTKHDPITIERIRVNGPYREALASYGWCVAESFSLKGYKSKVNDKELDIWLVGHESDITQAAFLVRSLLIQSDHALKSWWKSEGKANNPPINTMNQYIAKREFMFAFGSGVRERLSETRNRVVDEAGPGTELVLIDRSKKVSDWEQDNIKFSKTKSQGLKRGSYDAAMAGHAAGRSAVGNREVEH